MLTEKQAFSCSHAAHMGSECLCELNQSESGRRGSAANRRGGPGLRKACWLLGAQINTIMKTNAALRCGFTRPSHGLHGAEDTRPSSAKVINNYNIRYTSQTHTKQNIPSVTCKYDVNRGHQLPFTFGKKKKKQFKMCVINHMYDLLLFIFIIEKVLKAHEKTVKCMYRLKYVYKFHYWLTCWSFFSLLNNCLDYIMNKMSIII